MQKWITISVFLSLAISVSGQVTTAPHCGDPRFHEEVAEYTTEAVDLIDVSDVHAQIEDLVLLDAREKEEYDVSHLPSAQWIGYDDFDLDRVKEVNKRKPVVVYCSIGYRSEQIGKKLKKAGFEKVYNLYGSIFEWGNRGLPLMTSSGEETRKIHTYNRKWSKWVLSDELEKVW
jgi:rhodanese-related sulfurtransferase